MRKKMIRLSYLKLVLISCLVGLLSAIVGDTLKNITAHYEDHIFETILQYRFLFLIFPAIGLLLIFFLRTYAFKKKRNKGIKEIYDTLDTRHNHLPAYKVPSHYANGFLTVIFGGSTGVEVSTVVAAATVGAVTGRKTNMPQRYKTELVCAGVAAGVTALFGSPLTGLLFALEVIARKKVSKTIIISTITATLVAWLFLLLLHEKPLFELHATGWRWQSLPYILLLSILSGFLSVLFTKSVIHIKYRFAGIENEYTKIAIGALILGIFIFILPHLFGDGYGAVSSLIHEGQTKAFTLSFACTLLAVILLKPFIASVTLGAGGDGGVFAPSIVMGALLGLLMAIVCNQFFHAQLAVVNFILVGIAAVLSASIHAPYTATALACRFAGGYVLAVPVFIASLTAKYTAKLLYADTVYTYGKAVTPAPVVVEKV